MNEGIIEVDEWMRSWMNEGMKNIPTDRKKQRKQDNKGGGKSTNGSKLEITEWDTWSLECRIKAEISRAFISHFSSVFCSSTHFLSLFSPCLPSLFFVLFTLCIFLVLFLRLWHLETLHFLDATTQLYKRSCPYVRPSVRPSVDPSVPWYFQMTKMGILRIRSQQMISKLTVWWVKMK